MDDTKTPLVSIVTPSYNQGKFVSETIDSVLRQDYKDIEYIVVDGGSTDNTLDILKGYEDRFKWISEKDEGQADAINKGWIKARGSILAYLNSDDTYFLKNSVSIAVEYLRNNPDVGIVYGRSVFVDSDGRRLGYYDSFPFEYDAVFRNCLNPIPQPSAFLKREVIEKVGYLDENVQFAMDWDLWLRAGRYFKIKYIPDILSTYRIHPDSKTISGLLKLADDTVYIYKKLFSSGLSESIKKDEDKVMAIAYSKSAQRYFAGGDLQKAGESFLRALKLNHASLGMREYIKLFLTTIPSIGIYIHKKYFLKRYHKLLFIVKS